ncbi:hypothetical protein NCCP2140_32020 [Pseudoalteromonas sp. NCCP-2140]|uniref:glycosyltransferase n=1 Tax=Pseudoalteromonas sp. NCCP-2140 TaxID=2942288 RepID=UPI00203D14E4|nr:glycosyltransferase family 4 protein [Pseudoalteromonas sp. NCCP-2140]GKW54149.1 hypothetical protein NCCP2140_32020 [Pseudoalteromonas sp. NCCP-2140]
MLKNEAKIYLTGKLPPPIGGVTKFIQYFLEATTNSKIDNYTALLDCRTFFKFWLLRDAVLVVNASNTLKRFFFVLLGKLLFRKVFFVKHGGQLFKYDFLFLLALMLSDGVLCLNRKVFNALGQSVNKLMITTIFQENRSHLIRPYQEREVDLLLYANNDSEIEGKSVYGLDFIIEAIDELNFSPELTIVDLSGKYREPFLKYENITYLSNEVDFIDLLSRTKVYLRPTITDGMSVAILEALSLGVTCLASDAVDRPKGVITYKLNDIQDFILKLEEVLSQKTRKRDVELTSIDSVITFVCSGVSSDK